jgi:hypothetical protein
MMDRLRRTVAIALLLAGGVVGCGDDNNQVGGVDGAAGADGSAGADGAAIDATLDGPTGDAFIRGDGGYPDNVGARCTVDSECGAGGVCLRPDFFCSEGFCSKQSCTASSCPAGSVCAVLPILDGQGGATAITHCFLPCNLQNDCGDPGRLYCDVGRHICAVGEYLGNLGSLGARGANGQACVAPPPPAGATLFGPNSAASNPQIAAPSEPHLAVDPGDASKVYIAYHGGGAGGLGTTISASANGGASWTYHAVANVDSNDLGDPVLAVDPTTHHLWHVYLTYPASQCGPTMPYPGNNRVHAVEYVPGASPALQPPRTVNDPAYQNATYFLDKPWLTIGPDGTIYVTYTVFRTSAALVTDIVLASSTDHGVTWHNLVVSDTTPDRAHGRQLSGVTTDGSGTVYVVWSEDSGGPEDLGGYVWMTRSSDRGATVLPANLRVTTPPEVLFDDPQVVVSPDGGRLYIVYGAAVPGGGADAEDVKAVISTDRGATWSAPLRLDDEPPCATHWHPAATSDANGNLWAIWYDVRYGDGRIRWVKVAPGGGGALAVLDSGWATDAAFPFSTARDHFFIGDYIGLAAGGGKLFAAWGDLREIPAGGRLRIYYASGAIP